MPQYLAATIGPIYYTISHAVSTKAIWTASYLFSYLMREIAKEMKDEGNILLPSMEDLDAAERAGITDQVGLFPDRFFMEVGEPNKAATKLKDVLKRQIDILADVISKDLSMSEECIVNFLNAYLNYSFVTYEAETSLFAEIGNKSLDCLEMTPNFSTSGVEFEEILLNFLELKVYNEFVKKFKKQNRLTTIPDISSIARGKVEKTLFQRQKYVAVCNLDADHIGKLLKETKNHDEIKLVSKALFNYSEEAYKIVNNFGGLTVYSGGDDLFFFAPLVNEQNNQDIIGLICELNQAFIDKVTKNKDLSPLMERIKPENMPSLSAGISLSYEKYPLKEMMILSHKRLSDAKVHRNAIAFSLRKHSGQTVEAILDKSDIKTLLAFKALINFALKNPSQDALLSSMLYRFSAHKTVFSGMLETFGADFVTYLPYWFQNNFNEKPHENNKFIELIESLFKYILLAHYDQGNKKHTTSVESALAIFLASVRYVNFLTTSLKR